MDRLLGMETRRSAGRRAWVPPLASAGVLFALFLAAVGVRRSPFADAGRPVMIALSTAAAVGIALLGARMALAARVRGIGSAVAGLAMVAMGVYTAIHVLK